jgi:type II secretory pathway pseudopilin PulG
LKKFMLIGSLVAIVVAALALPALAQDRFFGDDDNNRQEERQAQRFANFLEDFYADDERWDGNYWWENDWWNDNDRLDEVDPAVSQSFDQQAVSGDVSQSFNVSNTGGNSNQCANVQGVTNTGNAQNQIGVLQYGSEADDFSFEDSGASINVSPNSATKCDQQVNQAASASYYGW